MARLFLVTFLSIFILSTRSIPVGNTTSQEKSREITLNAKQAQSHRIEEMQSYDRLLRPYHQHQENLRQKWRINPTRIHDQRQIEKLDDKMKLHKDNFHHLTKLIQAGGTATLGKSPSGNRFKYGNPRPSSPSSASKP